jgi:flavodoxin
MYKYVLLGLCALGIVALSASKLVAKSKPENNVMIEKNSKVLVAYYSYSGNTATVAKVIADLTGGNLFEIKAEGTYPDDYSSMTKQAKKEIESGFRPKLTTKLDDISQYDVIFIGSPNWWGTITPQISSFLETYDLTGKKVVPFITHGGGGVQNTVKNLTQQCKGCTVSNNPWVGYGSRIFGLEDWVNELKE